MMTRHYGTGYGQASRKDANLPTHIICKGICGRVKGSDCYSAKQLDILLKKMRETPGFDARKMPYIVCTSDTSQQVNELFCVGCQKWMGLDKFTKAQRKTPDNAQCKACVKERVEMEPHEVGRDDEDGEQYGSDGGKAGSSGDDDDYDDYTVNGATGGISTMSMSNKYPSQSGASTGGGGVNLSGSTAPTTRPATSAKASSVAGTASTARSRFDPSRYGGGSTKSSGGGSWAKVPAGPPKPTKKKAGSDDDDDDDKQLIDDSD